jgi:hypothetical protein
MPAGDGSDGRRDFGAVGGERRDETEQGLGRSPTRSSRETSKTLAPRLSAALSAKTTASNGASNG